MQFVRAGPTFVCFELFNAVFIIRAFFNVLRHRELRRLLPLLPLRNATAERESNTGLSDQQPYTVTMH